MDRTKIAIVALAAALVSLDVSAAAQVAESVGATMTLAAAQANIGTAALDDKVLAETMSSLSAADQKAYFAALCEAIAAMPQTAEYRTERYVAVCRTVLMNAKKGNLTDLVVGMFSNVEFSSLPNVVEMSSAELFNRAADADRPFTDEEFTKIAKDIVSRVEEAGAGDKVGSARTAMVILMFLKASNGTPANLAETLASAIGNEEQRNLATEKWFPAAMGENQPKTYDPIMGYVGEVLVAMPEVPLYAASTLHQATLLANLATEAGISASQTGGEATAGADRPRTTDPTKPWNPSGTRSSGAPEPSPYNNQTF